MPQEAPGSPRRLQETPGGPRRPQEAPGGSRRPQETSGDSRRLLESTGGSHEAQILSDVRVTFAEVDQIFILLKLVRRDTTRSGQNVWTSFTDLGQLGD